MMKDYFRKIKAVGSKAVIALGLATAPITAQADFYDGVRGPNTAQVHYTASSANGNTSHSIAVKYFGDPFFAAIVGQANGNEITGGFAGVGYLLERWERIKALPVVGYAVSGDGKQGTAVGVAQATFFLDKKGTFLLDPRYVISVPAHGQSEHMPQHTLGMSASLGNEQIRLGPDLAYQSGQNPTLEALLRFDIDAQNHSSWVQFGLGTTGSMQLQFRGNF